MVVGTPLVKHQLPSGASLAEIVFTVISVSRMIQVTLAPDFPVGPVEVIVISKA